MAPSLITYEPPEALKTEGVPSDSASKYIAAGLGIIILFFGGFGGWALTAPLNAAVIGEAVVKVEGNRKSIQHIDGGIVKKLHVSDGDRVEVGDILLSLDDTEARAGFDILSQQYALLRAMEARLLAELNGREVVEFPSDLAARANEPEVSKAMEGQRTEFESRKLALIGESQILDQRISQLREQIIGSEAQAASFRDQHRSVVNERNELDGLYKKGLVTRPRLLELERAAAGLEGQIASTDAAIASARQNIEELVRQIAQLRKNRTAEVTRDLSDAQSKLRDVTPRLHNAAAVLGRTEVRSPYAGKVVDLSVFSVGGVIGRGERILDIVPDRNSLVVEAHIHVEDISDLHPGMNAEVHFTSYKQRTIPLIHGTVTQMSADRLTDEHTGIAYYLATVAVNEEELGTSAEIKLYPGMPATVMIPTRERTAFDYLVGPLVSSFDQAFRQR